MGSGTVCGRSAEVHGPIASFQSEHLIPNLKKDLLPLRAKLSERTQAVSISSDALLAGIQ